MPTTPAELHWPRAATFATVCAYAAVESASSAREGARRTAREDTTSRAEGEGWGTLPAMVRPSLAFALVVALGAGAQAQPRPEVDLIHHLGLVVRVSSTVGNGRDLPGHLIDGDPGTAWSSRTGELAGARIEVDVPADATDTAVALTPGFTRTTPQDLFRMNPRVARVEVLRDGARVREFALDVDRPVLQSIPVDGRGGRWGVRVLATVPGTRATWRELSVSEFRVMGRAPRRGRGAPQVWVEGAALGRGRRAIPIAGPFESADAYCATREDADPVRCVSPYGDGEPVCGCVRERGEGASPEGAWRLVAPRGPVRSAGVLRVVEDVHDLDPCVLLIDTARGTFALAGFAQCGEPRIAHDYAWSARIDAFTAVATPGGGARLTLRVREREDRADMSEAGGPPETTTETRSVLTVAVSAAGEVVSAVRAPSR